MEHRREAELRSQVLRVTGKLLQGLGRSLEPEIVECPLVDPDEGIEQMGQGKDDMEVRPRQQ
jgi:hypothetical protein